MNHATHIESLGYDVVLEYVVEHSGQGVMSHLDHLSGIAFVGGGVDGFEAVVNLVGEGRDTKVTVMLRVTQI